MSRGQLQLAGSQVPVAIGEARPLPVKYTPKRGGSWLACLPLVVLPVWTVAVGSSLPAWAFMWTLVAAIFASCKWLTWWQTPAGRYGVGRSLGYLLLWPGMDVRLFLNVHTSPTKPTASEWAAASLKTAFGVVLLWGVARLVPSEQTLIRGWVGIVGLGFVLHFGVFHLLALAWQTGGVDARPIFCAPARALSLSDFWGARWNLSFRQLAHDFLFRPLVGRLGLAGATLVTFVASGLVHDLVISLPAAGGFGLPTAYFTLQGLGLLVERSRLGKRLGLRRGLAGWLFTLLFTAGPAYCLFHPPFVTRVVVPFMQAIGAL